jgi:transposase InsO family protein
MQAALKQLGIEMSLRTCSRLLELNRALYAGLDPDPPEPGRQPMPFAARRRHQYWTVDIRYLDMPQLGGGQIYAITILENDSRAILASAVSRTQDTAAYLMVLYAAIEQHGSPETLLSDGGSVFRSTQAQRIYQAVQVHHQRIDPGQS